MYQDLMTLLWGSDEVLPTVDTILPTTYIYIRPGTIEAIENAEELESIILGIDTLNGDDMAVKPEDCLKVTPEEETLVRSLEKEIDAHLMLHFTSIDATVDFKLPQDAFNRMNTRTFNRLHSIYANMGWSVNQVSKTIDKSSVTGNYLQFKKYQPSTGYFDR